MKIRLLQILIMVWSQCSSANSVITCLNLFKEDTISYHYSFRGNAEPTSDYSIRNEALEKVRRRADRVKIVRNTHIFSAQELIGELQKSGKMVYVGNQKYVKGTEFLASNEFDWSKTPVDNEPTDLLIGFGTNSAWDLALRKRAKLLVIGDWSPWPIIGQAYLIAPLLRIAKTPQEFILMLSGIPRQFARGISVSEAFQMAVNFDRIHPIQQRADVLDHLENLVADLQISDHELKFLTSYYSPRLGAGLSPNGFGPFQGIRSSSMALLNGFYSARYSAGGNHHIDSVFSSQENFNYLKKLFSDDRVKYGLTAVDDPLFYAAAKQMQRSGNLRTTTISVSNIFDCGCDNGLTFTSFQNYLRMVVGQIGDHEPIVFFRTTNNRPPHGFYRYQIQNESQIPKKDEVDSSALKRAG